MAIPIERLPVSLPPCIYSAATRSDGSNRCIVGPTDRLPSSPGPICDPIRIWSNGSILPPWLGGETLGRALVIGCGLGDDAELLAATGWSVVAFDISAEAIRWARERFPQSNVDYCTVDLFDAPSQWRRQFDLVVEIYTLQVLPPGLRAQAVEVAADWVSVGGLLCLIARGREESDPPGQMPWPLTEREVRAFGDAGLHCEVLRRFSSIATNRPSGASARFSGESGRANKTLQWTGPAERSL